MAVSFAKLSAPRRTTRPPARRTASGSSTARSASRSPAREAARNAGTNEFVALLDLDEGVDNPLLGIPAARDLQATMAKRALGEPPSPRPLEVIGSYSG